MTTEENKAIVRRYWDEVINRKNIGLLDQILAPGYVGHFDSATEAVRGTEARKQRLSDFFSSFPDLHVTIDSEIAEGDLVVACHTTRGTHKGTFMGVPPTGKQVSMMGIAIYRLGHGKIVEEWHTDDLYGVMRKLGAISVPGKVEKPTRRAA